ncbi:MAG TPA: YlxM family DNA-binding protein [Bacillota bacterium]|nr:YlxM family DNA-binding protein [Bacillota bacterium]
MEREGKPLEKMVRTGLLYDFYGGLLTEKQRQAMEKYYLENWSLAEIASSDGVTRQAVYDLLHRSERMVQEYEEKLGLLDRFLKMQTTLAGLNGKIEQILAGSPADDSNYKLLQEIRQEISQLIELA